MLNFERDEMAPGARRMLSDMHWKGECPGEEILKLRQRIAELQTPRPMSEAPRDGTWALVAVQVRPDKHRWRTAHYDVKLKSWIEGGNMVLRGLREPVAWLPHTPVTTAPGGSEEGE